MTKLVISDLDGTLLMRGQEALDENLFRMIRAMLRENILFCVASGRSYHELHRFFEPVCNDVVFVAHDGALGMYRGRTLFVYPIETRALHGFSFDAWNSMDCDMLFAGKYLTYCLEKRPGFDAQVRRAYKNHVMSIDCMMKIPEDVLKVALHREGGNLPMDNLKEKNRHRLHMAYEGDGWREFVQPGVNKGAALRELERIFSVSAGNTIAFGDNCNDIEMLDEAGTAYAVGQAKPEVAGIAGYRCVSVVDTLRQMFPKCDIL